MVIILLNFLLLFGHTFIVAYILGVKFATETGAQNNLDQPQGKEVDTYPIDDILETTKNGSPLTSVNTVVK